MANAPSAQRMRLAAKVLIFLIPVDFALIVVVSILTSKPTYPLIALAGGLVIGAAVLWGRSSVQEIDQDDATDERPQEVNDRS